MTLLEVLVAVVLVGFAGVAVMAASGTQLRVAERAERTAMLAALAEERLGRAAATLSTIEGELPDSLRAGTLGAPLASYRWELSATMVSDMPGLLDLRVVVADSVSDFALVTRVYRRRAPVTAP